MKQLLRARRGNLCDSLSADEAALLHSFGEAGAAVLQPPRRAEHLLNDDEFILTLRYRLLIDDPAGASGTPCANVRQGTGVPCGEVSSRKHAKHALDCPVGWGPTIRHDFRRDALAAWLEEHHGASTVKMEQRIPQWDKDTNEGTQLAVLDVVFSPAGGRVAVDISVVNVLASSDVEARARARAGGVAARERERQKHRRYPGPGLVAAALETGGRFGRELTAFLKEHAPSDVAIRPLALADVRQRLGAALARGNAAMLLRSAGAAQRPWPTRGQLSVANRGSP